MIEGRKSRVEGKTSRVEGRKSRVEGKTSRVEGKTSRVEGKKSTVKGRRSEKYEITLRIIFSCAYTDSSRVYTRIQVQCLTPC